MPTTSTQAFRVHEMRQWREQSRLTWDYNDKDRANSSLRLTMRSESTEMSQHNHEIWLNARFRCTLVELQMPAQHKASVNTCSSCRNCIEANPHTTRRRHILGARCRKEQPAPAKPTSLWLRKSLVCVHVCVHYVCTCKKQQAAWKKKPPTSSLWVAYHWINEDGSIKQTGLKWDVKKLILIRVLEVWRWSEECCLLQ